MGGDYRSAIFYTDDAQNPRLKKLLINLTNPISAVKIVTTLEPAGTFWSAEDYHQKFTQRTGRGMCHIAYAPV